MCRIFNLPNGNDEDSDDDGNEENYQPRRHSDWQSTHEELMNQIRRDRKLYQEKLEREATGI